MRKNFIKIIKYALLPGIMIFLLFVLLPRNYHVPQLQNRPYTKYWDLQTGSHIAYTLIPGKGIKKPYPLIYLHGGPGGSIFDRNIKMLSPLADDGYDVYLYDQVGCGLSNRLKNIEDYTTDRHKRDLEAIIKIIGTEKVILIGQSWGAILAVLFMADNPEKADKVIFTGPGPIYPINEELAKIQPPDSLHMRKPASTNAEANRKAANIRTRFVTYFAVVFGLKLASDKEMDNFQTYLNGLNKATVCDTSLAPETEAGGGFYSQIMTVRSLNEAKDPRPGFKGNKIPVLIMKGQCDNQKWGYLSEYLELFPDHQLEIIPDAGHSIAIEQPELYLKTIRDFLSE